MFTLEIIGCMLLFSFLTCHISLLTAVDGTPFPFRKALLQGLSRQVGNSQGDGGMNELINTLFFLPSSTINNKP